jgi:hypothetical protein
MHESSMSIDQAPALVRYPDSINYDLIVQKARALMVFGVHPTPMIRYKFSNKITPVGSQYLLDRLFALW